VFREYTGEALLDALGRAVHLYQDRPRWRALQLAGMREDNSWDRSAQEYVKIYERVSEKARTTA
jgi:starch synthase